MKAFKLHFKPMIVEAENEEAAEAYMQEHVDKIEINLFEEVNLDAI